MEFIALIVVIAAVFHRVDRRLRDQAKTIADLQQAVARLSAQTLTAPPPLQEHAAQAAPPDGVAADTVPADAVPPPFLHAPADLVLPDAPESAAAPAGPPEPPPPSRSFWRDLEESFASRWLMWLGGGTMALAAVFFIKLSIEHGWLGAGVRVTLGLLSGLGLIVGGEWLRRQPLQRAIAAIHPHHAPVALTGAGLFAAFASVYGGYALFGLFDPLIAFALLAGLALGGVALSLLQGPFIAALGLLAGYVTPILVSSGNPMAWGLFPYLLALNGATAALVLWRGWGWLAWGALVGAVLWPFLWFIDAWRLDDTLVVGLYTVLSAALFLWPALVSRWIDDTPDGNSDTPAQGWRAALPRWLWNRAPRHPFDRLGRTAATLFGLVMLAMLVCDGHRASGLTMLGLYAAGGLVAARRVERLAGLAWTAGLTVWAGLIVWDVPELAQIAPLMNAEGRPLLPGAPVGFAEEIGRALWSMAGFAALFGVGGFLAGLGARRVALWASLSALLPLALLATLYAHLAPDRAMMEWPGAALALAALLVAATTPLARRRGTRSDADLALAAYAAGAVGALTLAATMILRDAWLTVALAAQVPVLAWLERHFTLRELRRVAFLVGLVVLTRLALNPLVLEYQGVAWIFYGYGLPALFFLMAARWMRQAPGDKADDLTVMVLEAGALVFATLLASLAVHRWMADDLKSAPSTLVEAALHTLSWLGLALLLAVDRRWSLRPVARWGRRVLLGMAAAACVTLHLFGFNPLMTGESVGEWPVVNRLLLAYGAPGLLMGLILWVDPLRTAALRRAAAGLAGLLLAVNLALEIRRFFQGANLMSGGLTDAEWYSYSVAFLLVAVLLLVAALRWGWGGLRHVGLALLLAVVAKVFISDMEGLTGLYRVASFLGLGVCLIGVGFLYQRMRLPALPPESSTANNPLDERTH
ncbi:DUF2339 domain-containing protein [Azospirillum griseum]|uniref:DUF2339 domain-containing protein n=1 Tax=Azospirillum griseum TaxID=2496639 RepID=A0A3S0R6Z1_9PROT|nr:DUF2339 domain-containing protein [Azospirillum griseum]RTR17251.1 DUF2339 domain-containing protein [Azospirillum griseum]